MINISAIILLAFISLSCSSSKQQGENSSEYIPFAAGNTWEYSIEGTDSISYSVKVLNIKKQDGVINADFNYFPFFFLSEDKKIVRSNSNGEIIMLNAEGLNTNFFPSSENLKKGYTWSAGGWQARVTGTDETVIAAEKTFEKCIHLSYSLSITFNAEMWIAPGTGIVKWGFHRTNPPSLKFEYYVLKDYSLK